MRLSHYLVSPALENPLIPGDLLILPLEDRWVVHFDLSEEKVKITLDILPLLVVSEGIDCSLGGAWLSSVEEELELSSHLPLHKSKGALFLGFALGEPSQHVLYDDFIALQLPAWVVGIALQLVQTSDVDQEDHVLGLEG